MRILHILATQKKQKAKHLENSLIAQMEIVSFLVKYKITIAFLLLLGAFIFLRFYQLPERAIMGWDQADSAWAAKSILYDHFFRLQGVPIKGDANMFMGPLYYYLITPFYFFSRLDMIASPVFAGVVSVINFCVFFIITRKLFNIRVAFIAGIIYTFSAVIIGADRVQAAFTLIPSLSYVIFYFLYRFLMGDEKSILYLAIAIGFGFHVHFTTVFYFPIILCTRPFFPRTKKALIYSLFAVVAIVLFLFPMLYSTFFAKNSTSNSILSYLSASSHGFHLRRMLQISHDAFISFQSFLQTDLLRPFVFLVLPIFAILFYLSTPQKKRKKGFVISYLAALWILIPWIAFTIYNGELTDYYFSLPRDIGIVMISFIIIFLFEKKYVLLRIFIVMVVILFIGYDLNGFFTASPGNYLGIKQYVTSAIQMKKKIQFKGRDPIFYTYYIYTKYRKN